MLKKKLFGYDGERWKGFKTQLTHDYNKYPNDNLDPPYVKYPYMDNKVRENIVKSHTTPDFLAKSQKKKGE